MSYVIKWVEENTYWGEDWDFDVAKATRFATPTAALDLITEQELEDCVVELVADQDTERWVVATGDADRRTYWTSGAMWTDYQRLAHVFTRRVDAAAVALSCDAGLIRIR